MTAVCLPPAEGRPRTMAGPIVAFEHGDAIPNYVLNDVRGRPNGPVIDSRGRPMGLVFCRAVFDTHLAPFAEQAQRLKQAVDLSIVTPLTREDNLALARRLNLPWGVLSDPTDEVGGHFAFAGAGLPLPALTTYALDSGLRVLAVGRDGWAGDHIENTLAAIREAMNPATAGPGAAPVLWIPRVLDAPFCQELVGVAGPGQRSHRHHR
ncbi:MAG: hypothetical protein EXQ85_05700 [Alphaproteobacteria bacterium]|nr:hypothetical protein [Alphaproteobacteria bacterium]